MDKKAVKILFNKYWSSQGWVLDQKISTEELEYAKSKNVMFDDLVINHKQAVDWLLNTFSTASKEHLVKCFVSSLSTRRLDLRSGLSSYGFAKNFPDHQFSLGPHKFCTICGLSEQQMQDVNILNFERLKWGGVRLTDPIYVAWNLQILNKEPAPEPTLEDVDILKQIIFTIEQCDREARPTHLEKKLAKVFRSSADERRVIIDMFGICGILENNQHKGFFETYIPLNGRSIRPINKTDWEYPVDWWTGKDGVNKVALDFYFANYLQ